MNIFEKLFGKIKINMFNTYNYNTVNNFYSGNCKEAIEAYYEVNKKMPGDEILQPAVSIYSAVKPETINSEPEKTEE
jgi:hypothetical protein